MVPGIYAATPTLFAWLANNSEPHYRRATSIAAGFMSANAVRLFFFVQYFDNLYTIRAQGGILSTWRYPTKEGPKYRKTTIMNLIL
jgi:hypothetical protein